MCISKLVGAKTVLACVAAASLAGCSSLNDMTLTNMFYPDTVQMDVPVGYASTDGVPQGIAKYFDEIRVIQSTTQPGIMIIPQNQPDN